MAIGTISSPAAWVLRQVMPHTWCQNVQDNINFHYGSLGAGTKTAYSLQIDGVGNQTVATTAGTLKISTANPATTTAFSNSLTASNIPKAWGNIETAAPFVNDGFNVASIADSPTANRTRVTMASAMANSNYAVMLQGCDGSSVVIWNTVNISTTAFDICGYDAAGVAINLWTVSVNASFVVFGKQ